jgi:hypothetical protein
MSTLLACCVLRWTAKRELRWSASGRNRRILAPTQAAAGSPHQGGRLSAARAPNAITSRGEGSSLPRVRAQGRFNRLAEAWFGTGFEHACGVGSSLLRPERTTFVRPFAYGVRPLLRVGSYTVHSYTPSVRSVYEAYRSSYGPYHFSKNSMA